MGHLYPDTGMIPVVSEHFAVFTALNCYILLFDRNLKTENIKLLKSSGGEMHSLVFY